MHTPLQGDAPPDAPEYLGHVVCEHGQLSLVSTARRSISTEVGYIHLARVLLTLSQGWGRHQKLIPSVGATLNSRRALLYL